MSVGVAAGALIAAVWPSAVAHACSAQIDRASGDWCADVPGIVASSGDTITLRSTDEGFDSVNVTADGQAWRLDVQPSTTVAADSAITLGSFDDTIVLADRLVADRLSVDAGDGDNAITVGGQIGALGAGAGNDTVTMETRAAVAQDAQFGSGADHVTIQDGAYLAGSLGFDSADTAGDFVTTSGRIDGDVNFGAGNDELVLEAPSVWKPLIGGQVNGGGGSDVLRLSASDSATPYASVNLGQVQNVEQLVKSGPGDWTVSSDDAVTFADGLTVEDGTLLGSGLRFVDTDLDNAGTIAANPNASGDLADAPWRFDSSDDSGVDILNRAGATIAADMTLSDGDDTYQNDGTLEARVDMLAGNDTFINDGTIASTATVDTGDGDDTLNNLGTIQSNALVTMGAGADTVTNDGRIAPNARIETGAGADTVTNRGTLEGVVDTGDGADVLDNAGTLSGTVTLGAGDDRVVNSGEIGGSVDTGSGVDTYVQEDGARLTGRVDLGTGDDQITLNGGTFAGTLDAGGGNDRLTLAGGGGTLGQLNAAGAPIVNLEDINVTSGAWEVGEATGLQDIAVDGSGAILTLNNPISVENEIQILNGTLVANSTVNATNGTRIAHGGTLSMNGTLHGDLDSSGDLHIGGRDNIGTTTLTGDARFADGSRVIVEVDETTNTADRLDVSGSVTIDPGAVISLDSPHAAGDPVEYEVIISGGTRTGEFTVQNSGVTQYEVLYRDNSVLLSASHDYSGVSSGVSHTINTLPTGVNLQENVDQGLVDASLRSALYDVAIEDYAHALEELNGEGFGNVLFENREQARTNLANVFDRLSARDMCGTLQGRPEQNCRAADAPRADVWAEGMFETRSYERERASFDAQTNSYGGLVGLDTNIGNTIVGAFAGYQWLDQEIDLKNRAVSNPTHINADTHQLGFGAYGRVPLVLVNLDAAASYGHGLNSTMRDVQVVGTLNDQSRFAEKVESEFTTQHINARVGIGQEYRTFNGFEFEPRVSASADYIFGGDLREQASNGGECQSCLDVAWDDDVDYRVGASIDLRQHLLTMNGVVITPYAGFGFDWAIERTDTPLRTAFQDDSANSFDILGFAPDTKVAYDIDVGISLESDTGFVGFGEYGASIEDAVWDHAVTLGVRTRF